jgi:hypothetical protein
MTLATHSCGPIEFKHRRRGKHQGDSSHVGGNQLSCDVDGCRGAAVWAGNVMGWDIGSYCGPHKTEMLAVAHDALDDVPAVAA